MKSAHTEVSRRPAHDTLTEVMLSCTEMTSNTCEDNCCFYISLAQTCSTIGGPVNLGFQPEMLMTTMSKAKYGVRK